MVGNDIVDISEAKKRSNWQRPRFLTKLFTRREQNFIENDDHPFLMVWRLWSMKEAAYKLYTQMHEGRFFNPKGFECCVENTFGTVTFKNFQCFVETQMDLKFILSEAKQNRGKFKSKVVPLDGRCPKQQSFELQNQVLNQFKKSLKDKCRVQLEYTDFGVPLVKVKNTLHHVSLTHHGCFGAFAIA